MRREKFMYNRQSKLVLSELDSNGDGKISWRETIEYDERGNLVLRESANANGNVTGRDISEYNDDSKQLSSKQFSSSGGLLSGWIARYDGQNLIQKDRLNEDGRTASPLSMTTPIA